MWLLFALLLAVAFVLVMVVLGTIALVVAALHAMPWLLILAGIWLLVRATRVPGHGRRAEAAERPGRRPAPRAAPQRPVERRPVDGRSGDQRPAERPARRPRPEARPRRELPIDVQVKVEQIRRKADVLLGYADRFPPCSQDLHIVRQTAAEYLPRTVGAYLALPGDDDPVVGAGGKTALHELREQLQLLDSKLDDITQDLQRHDLDRLLANRRFLEERFRLREREARVDPPRRETGAA